MTTITSATELNALPVNSVVLKGSGHVYQRDYVRGPGVTWIGWYAAGNDLPCTTDMVLGEHPGWVTVLHIPGQVAVCDRGRGTENVRQDVPAMSAALRAVLDLHAPEITEGVDLGEPWCVACGDASPCPTELAITTHLDGRGVHEVIGAAVLALLSGRTEAEVKAEALRKAVEEFESHVGVGEFEEQTIRDGIPWSHTAEAWEQQGPFMAWLRNRADEFERGEGR